MPDASQSEFPEAWILESTQEGARAGDPGPPRIFGLTSAERLTRSLERMPGVQVRQIPAGSPPPETQPTQVVLLRDDYFYDERLVQGLMEAAECLLCSPDSGDAVAAKVSGSRAAELAEKLRQGASGQEPAFPPGVARREPLDLVPAYNSQLRKFDPPFLLAAREDTVREAENRVFAASYKGITDFITKHVFPRPALAVVRVLARRGVRPNTVTLWSYLLTAFVILAFAWGWFGIGLLASWLMTFLDTVDGKLARVTLTSSKLGGFLDHALDMVHPPIWWWAWGIGIGLGVPGVETNLWIIVGGYVLGRILEGIFLAWFKMEMFTWRPFDAHFRAVIARRNPNLLLLTLGLLAGSPSLGYAAVALWTLACLVIAVVRIGQAATCWLRGEPIQSWYEQANATARPPAQAPESGDRG